MGDVFSDIGNSVKNLPRGGGDGTCPSIPGVGFVAVVVLGGRPVGTIGGNQGVI